MKPFDNAIYSGNHMMHPIIDLHNETLTQLGIQAIIDFYQTIAVDQLQFPGITAVVTKTNSPYLNVVIDTRSYQEDSHELVERLNAFFNKYQTPWNWFMTPIATNNLTELGFLFIEEAPGLYFDLTRDFSASFPASISIREATENDDLIEWIIPMQEGFPTEDGSPEDDGYRQINAKLLQQGEKKLRHFIAYYNGELAGAATLFLSKDSVMLHNLAVLKKFQRKGVGKALGLHRMAIAKQLGYKHCFLDASDEGFKLHKTLGFRVYCTTKIYNNESV